MPSPGKNYPQTGLGEAVERVELIYRKDHRNDMTAAVVATNMGYKGLTGTSASMIADLKKYGLLDGRGDSIRLSEDALTVVIEDEESLDRAVALRRIMANPEAFRQVYDKFRDGGSESNIRAFLQRQLGLPPKSADEATAVYQDTIRFVTEQTSGYNGHDTDKELDEPDMQTPLHRPDGGPPGDHPRDVQLPIATGPWPVLRAQFPMTESSWGQMMALLTAMKSGLVKTESTIDDPNGNQENE